MTTCNNDDDVKRHFESKMMMMPDVIEKKMTAS